MLLAMILQNPYTLQAPGRLVKRPPALGVVRVPRQNAQRGRIRLVAQQLVQAQVRAA